jgi:hypothetical protein
MKAVRKLHISKLRSKGDYCITEDRRAVMACPACGRITVITNRVDADEPLDINGPFSFPCPLVTHSFYCLYGTIHRAYDTIDKGDI